MTQSFHIKDLQIGASAPAFIIAEIGQAHEGSFGMAMAYIDAVAKTGADAVKFQTHIASAESTHDDEFRVPIAGYNSRYEYWEAMEFTLDQWIELATLAHEKGLIFLSSAFSTEAVELLNHPKINMPAWKVGSGEFRSYELLDAMITTGKPVLLSSGMSRNSEVDEAVTYFKNKNIPFGLFQCVSKYPTPLEEVGLNVIKDYKTRYNCPVGLSDHSAMIAPSLAAIAQGADMIEIHVTFSRDSFGPDAKSSLTMDELTQICEFRDNFTRMTSKPLDKDALVNELATMRTLFTKSIGLKQDLAAGTIITENMITPKKPASGINWDKKDEIIGRKLVQDVSSARLLRTEDLA